EDRELGDELREQRAQALEDDEGEHAGGDGDPEAPPGLQADVEVQPAHQDPEAHPHEDRAQRQLAHAVALVDLLEPLAFDLLGGVRHGGAVYLVWREMDDLERAEGFLKHGMWDEALRTLAPLPDDVRVLHARARAYWGRCLHGSRADGKQV